MKLAIVLSRSLGYIIEPGLFEKPTEYKKLDLAIATVANMGYEGIELFIENPRAVDVRKFRKIAMEYDVDTVAIGTGLMSILHKASFSDIEANRRKLAIELIRKCSEIASVLDATVIIGLIRGKAVKEILNQAVRWVNNCLKQCDDIAKAYDVTVALEPLNRYETNIINTVTDALHTIDSLGLERTGVLLDTFHMNIEEPSFRDAIKMAGSLLIHVHIADSNRWPPGYGHINFGEVLGGLKEIGYEEYLSAEMLPKPDHRSAAQATIRHIRRLLG